jgi:hypothetical protein
VAGSDPLLGKDLFRKRAVLDHIEETVIESKIPDVTVLRLAYLIESDFAVFYEMTATKVKVDGRQALVTLAAR